MGGQLMLADARVHATLPTSDVDALRPFYEDVLGFIPHAILASAVVYRAGEGSLFAISRSGGAASGSHTQVAFTVGDIEATVAELRGRGVVFEEYDTPLTVHGIARMGMGRGAWFRDPAGNLLAVAQFDEVF
jgi:catechol 2,3-dioxygenase-like lactoylglutathione lyase family enzyme